LAEESGLITRIGELVLNDACTQAARWVAESPDQHDLLVTVNLSARQVADDQIVEQVRAALAASGLDPHRLVLEITETALLQNREVARASLVGLRSIGAGVALDDFGTGYSSLSFLRELPVTGVKIDRSFVRDAVERTEDLAITEAIVRLAHGLGLETIAEGVETVEQRDLLRRLGCGSAQGFWWSAAVPMATLALALPGGRAAARIAQTREAGPARFGESPRQLRPPQRRLPEPALIGPNRTACCLRGGIDAGQAWLVVATPARRNTFARALGSLHTTAVMRGQLLELDAYDTMRKMTGPDGGLDPDRFDRVVGPMLQRLGATSADVGVHVELGPVNQPLLSTQVSTDLRRRLQALSPISLEYGDHAGDCSAHGPVPVQRLAVDGSTAS
jgi:EAL domain-containing protein (putative c-di-GMP-specific phosphodiesterase class I)